MLVVDTPVVRKAMAADTADRFASCREFITALEGPRPHALRKWAAAAIVLALAGLTWIWMSGARPAVTLHPVTIPSAAGRVNWLSLSPDGKKLYYAAGSYFFEYMDIYAKDLASGDTRALTTDGKFKLTPMCSPDGRRLVFLRDRGLNLVTAVEMPAAGGPERELFTGYVDAITWSIDSNALIVSSYGAKEMWPHLRGFDLRTSEWWDITAAPKEGRGDSFAALSPDGATLAFVRKESRESSDLYLLAVDRRLRAQGNPRRLTSLRHRIAWPFWSADGKALISTAGTLSNFKLYRAAADGRSEPRDIAEAGVGIDALAVASRTGRIVLAKTVEQRSMWRLDLATPMGPALRMKPIPVAPANPEGPALSPDGKSIAFVAAVSGEEQVWVAGADGSNARQVTFEPAVDGIHPVWLPDSSGLVVSVRSKAFGVRNFLFQPPAGPAREISGFNGIPVRYARDGKWLYFSSMKTGDVELYRYASQTGEIRPVTHDRRATFAIESGDGKALYYTMPEEDRGLWRMPLPAGPATQLVPQLARRSLFDVGTEGIYYMVRDKREAVIKLRRFADGRDYELQRLQNVPGWGFSLTHDERSLMFCKYDADKSQVLLLEGKR
jgi:Tol biopolymer transport system component